MLLHHSSCNKVYLVVSSMSENACEIRLSAFSLDKIHYIREQVLYRTVLKTIQQALKIRRGALNESEPAQSTRRFEPKYLLLPYGTRPHGAALQSMPIITEVAFTTAYAGLPAARPSS